MFDQSSALIPRYLCNDFYQTVQHEASEAGIPLGRDVIVEQQSLQELAACVCAAGGSISELSRWTERFAMTCHFSKGHLAQLDLAGADLTIMQFPEGARSMLHHATGIFRIELNGETYVVAAFFAHAPNVRRSLWEGTHAIALMGRTLSSVSALARLLHEVRTPTRLRGWGGAPPDIEVPIVQEADVVLPSPLKEDLFGWLDRFWRLRDRAAEFGLSPTRGLLLVGPPGTGKTQVARHLLTRFADTEAHLFIASQRLENDNEFRRMLTEASRSSGGVLIILEDIDQLLRSSGITREFLLNTLDGMLALHVPVLWVATSNDPSELDTALLQRPGRFDRIVAITEPESAEREILLRRACARFPVSEAGISAATRASAGLTGAHLKEAVAAAALRWIDGAAADLDEALVSEIETLTRQLVEAAHLPSGLMARKPVGFAAHDEGF